MARKSRENWRPAASGEVLGGELGAGGDGSGGVEAEEAVMPRQEGTCNQSESGKDRGIRTAGPGEKAKVMSLSAREGLRNLGQRVPGSSLHLR